MMMVCVGSKEENYHWLYSTANYTLYGMICGMHKMADDLAMRESKTILNNNNIEIDG